MVRSASLEQGVDSPRQTPTAHRQRPTDRQTDRVSTDRQRWTGSKQSTCQDRPPEAARGSTVVHQPTELRRAVSELGLVSLPLRPKALSDLPKGTTHSHHECAEGTCTCRGAMGSVCSGSRTSRAAHGYMDTFGYLPCLGIHGNGYFGYMCIQDTSVCAYTQMCCIRKLP